MRNKNRKLHKQVLPVADKLSADFSEGNKIDETKSENTSLTL